MNHPIIGVVLTRTHITMIMFSTQPQMASKFVKWIQGQLHGALSKLQDAADIIQLWFSAVA